MFSPISESTDFCLTFRMLTGSTGSRARPNEVVVLCGMRSSSASARLSGDYPYKSWGEAQPRWMTNSDTDTRGPLVIHDLSL
jgi:hypothetical protein